MKHINNALKAAAIVGIMSLGHLQPVHSQEMPTCSVLASYAQQVMDLRQMGKLQHQFLEDVQHDKILTPLINAAYQFPMHHSAQYKARAITEFTNGIYRACMEDPDNTH